MQSLFTFSLTFLLSRRLFPLGAAVDALLEQWPGCSGFIAQILS